MILRTSLRMGSCYCRCLFCPVLSGIVSIWDLSSIRRRISSVIGESFSTASSDSAGLNAEELLAAEFLQHVCFVASLQRCENADKVVGLGRFSRPSTSLGRASGSVFAFRIFLAIVSASSVRLMRDRSEGSDLDIFLVPSRSDMIRVAGPGDHRFGDREIELFGQFR